MTIRQDIRDRAIAEINADLPTGIPECGLRRYVPGERILAPRMAAFFGEEDAARVNLGRASPLTKRALTLVIQAIASVENIEDADDAVEPMLAHIVSRLGDTKLNNLAIDVTEMSTLWATAESNVVHVVALTRWRVEFQSKRDDLASAH